MRIHDHNLERQHCGEFPGWHMSKCVLQLRKGNLHVPWPVIPTGMRKRRQAVLQDKGNVIAAMQPSRFPQICKLLSRQ